MTDDTPQTYTAFDGYRRIAAGPLSAIALAVKRAIEAGAEKPILIFADATGQAIDIDTSGDDLALLARYAPQTRGRGRPKLGVTPREVTLLPRHWDWLNEQPGGASVTLRKLVEAARRTSQTDSRQTRDAAYRFMSAIAGDLPGFEEASRALFAGDQEKFSGLIAGWPDDIRSHLTRSAVS